VNKFMLMALGAGSMIALAAPAAAQNVSGDVTITGTVTPKCTVINGTGPSTFAASRDIGELAKADGTLEDSSVLAGRFGLAGGSAPTFRVVCTSANPKIAVDAVELTNAAAGVQPTGYTARVDFIGYVAPRLSSGAGTTVSNDSSTNVATAATAAGGRLAADGSDNLTVTADTFKTAPGALLASGNYTGHILIDITPGS
jgi:hypothetical protein